MRFLVFVIAAFAPIVSWADMPLPERKPLPPITGALDNQDNVQSIDSIIDAALQPKPNDVVLPPDIPNRKRPVRPPQKSATTQTTADFPDDMPYPARKPMKIRTTAGWQDAPSPQDRNLVNLDDFSDNHSERMAGGRRGGIERTPARPRIALRETTDESPFETAKLPRARTSQNDPVIIFFKENSSELEVGQIDILQSDVLSRLKRSSRRVAIYGYAERSHSGNERTHQISLNRALLIGNFLTDHGVSSSRIEARAMASDTPISPKDRVDIVIY